MISLVTGGAGFIGSHLTDHLIKNGSKVIVLDNLSTGEEKNINPKADFIEGSIEKTDIVQILLNVDFVFHAAALPRIQPSFDNPEEHDLANVQNTLKVLKAAKSTQVKKIIYSGSSSIYGNPSEVPTSENEKANPLNPYSLQKYTAEQYGLLLGKKWDIPFISLRYFNPYGDRSFSKKNPLNAYSSVIGIFQNNYLKNETLKITGNGSQQRDFVHVSDISRASVLLALSNENLNFFNIGFGKAFSVLEIAKQISENYCFIPARLGEADITLSNNDKLKACIDWEPEIKVMEYLDNWKKNLKAE